MTPRAFDAHGSGPVWLNLPPARVWTYRAMPDADDGQARPDLIDRLRLGGGKIGDELRELRAEWLARSAAWRERSQKVKSGLVKHGKRLRAARQARAARRADRLLH